jgi:prepilin-type N-terminal cleavage/methylation domain-containing protein
MSPARIRGNRRRSGSLRPYGFTLIELVMVIVVLGLVAAIVIPRMGGLSESSRITATKSEMLMLKRAIIGNPSAVAEGRFYDVGFEGDVGHPPASLAELGSKPDTVPVYDKFTRIGWNGPYVDTSGGEYLTDAWGVSYIYNPALRTIISVGGPDTIIATF